MKKFCSFVFFCFLVVVGTFYLPGLVGTGLAEDIGELAPLPQPNELVVVPNEQNPNQIMYMATGMPGVYVLNGTWYRNVGGAWWSSPAYNGIWTPVVVDVVPQVIVGVPPYYAYYLPPDYHRFRYDEYNRGWRHWDRAHFERQEWYRHEMRRDVREARLHHVDQRHTEMRNKERERHEVGHDQHNNKGKEVAKGGKPDLKDAKGKTVTDKNKNPQDRTKVTNGQQPTKGVNDKKVKDPGAVTNGQQPTQKGVKDNKGQTTVAKGAPQGTQTKVQQPKAQQPKTQQPRVQQPKAQQPKVQQAKAAAPKASAKPADKPADKKGGK